MADEILTEEPVKPAAPETPAIEKSAPTGPIPTAKGPVPTPHGQGRGPRGGGGGGQGGRGGNNRGGNRGNNRDRKQEGDDSGLTEKVVFINRCAKVVKGGRRFSFSALIVVGDQAGKVGIGFGKANEVSEAIRKGNENARKHLEPVSLDKSTIPHEVLGKFGGATVLLKPASEGTGLIAGGGARAIVEAAGIKDVLSKSLGSSNPANVVRATLEALKQLRKREDIMKARGKKFTPKA